MKRETINILLIEDNQDDIDLIKKAIKKTDYHNVVLTIARNGEEGITKLEESMKNKNKIMDRSRIDLIMCDVNMPKMNGIEFLAKIKTLESEYKRIPILMFTTSSNIKDIEESYDRFCNSYLTKPLSYLELVNLLNKILDYWSNNQYPLS